ncbi:hypothetical protein GCK32_008284 [Trichostrongylus colubriformis]|uniref:Uncharacterized protein n=1 Tax=Trichostrongylus colubriformis TaxID=6319 RepID=A0AAN8GF56_TRICO
MFQFKGEEAKRAFVKVSIRDAECYSSRSESSFVVFLAAMSYDDHHLSDVHIRSEKFVYDNLTNTHVFSGYLTIPSSYRNLNECFDDGNFDCVPRADVVYIRFESEPNDPWAIDQIDVDVTFRVTSNEESRDFDVSGAFIYVSEVDLQRNEVAWSFLPPMTDKDMKAARREQIKGFVENALTKGPKGLVAEFRKIPKHDDLTKMTEFVQQLANKNNRYRDVGCFDDNRVILTLGTSTYIHANYVATPSHPRKFVCTQGPLPHTCAHFWCMVVQEEADVILMLCNFTEMEQFNFPFETSTIVEVTNLDVYVPGCPLHSCIHYHWIDWPDRGVPQADLAPLYLLHEIVHTKTPIIIHCSAGIGRTGSMVLLQYAVEVLERGDVLRTMDSYLEEVRTQRSSSVQNEQQYLYVHQVLLNFLQKTGSLPQSLDPALESFKRIYHKITKGF